MSDISANLQDQSGSQPRADFLDDWVTNHDLAGTDLAKGDESPLKEQVEFCAQLFREATSGEQSSLYDTELTLPSHLGRYEIMRPLGAGAHAIVYLAIDPKLNRQVALKVPRPGVLACAELSERFARESETVARLTHPHLVPVFEFHRESFFGFIAQGYVEGPSLAEWIHVHGPLSASQAGRLVADLADAVHYIHSCGVIHRDLKPANVLLDPTNKRSLNSDEFAFDAKLTDFGLAKLLDPDQQLTQGEASIGTPPYMAPEQVCSKDGLEVGPTTDIYGLGTILYESLTGKPPYQGKSTAETLRLIGAGDLKRPSAYAADISADLEAICLKCLEYNPSRRYESGQALAEDLERFLKDEPVQARRITPMRRAIRWTRRRPLAALLLGLLAGSVLLGGAAVTWQWQRAERQRELAAENFSRAHLGIHDSLDRIISEHQLAGPNFTDLRRDLLGSALEYYVQLQSANQGNPSLDRDIADTYFQLAHAALAAGDAETALSFCDEAIPLWQDLRANSDDPELLLYLAKMHRIRGNALALLVRPQAEVLASLQTATDFLDDLASDHPRNTEYLSNFAESLLTTGSVHRLAGNVESARKLADQAVGARRKALAIEASSPLLQRQFAEALYRRSAARAAVNDWHGVASDCEDAVEILETLLEEDDFTPSTTQMYVCRCQHMLYASALKLGDTGSARRHLEKEISGLQELLAEFPEYRNAKARLMRAKEALAALIDPPQ